MMTSDDVALAHFFPSLKPNVYFSKCYDDVRYTIGIALAFLFLVRWCWCWCWLLVVLLLLPLLTKTSDFFCNRVNNRNGSSSSSE